MKLIKKVLIMIICLCVLIEQKPIIYASHENTTLTLTLDGEVIKWKEMFVQYRKEDGSYEKPGKLNGPGEARIFLYYIIDDYSYYVMRNMSINTGNNKIQLSSDDFEPIEIELGEQIDVVDDFADIVFWELEDMNITLKLNQTGTTIVYLDKGLIPIIKQISIVNQVGQIGIAMSMAEGFEFDGNYCLQPITDTRQINMLERPSFNDLFNICFHNDIAIDDIFIYGEGGGTNYRYYDQQGNAVLESRFGSRDDGLHFEGLDAGVYDMEFSINDGDLILKAEDMIFINGEENKTDPSQNKLNEVQIEVPLNLEGKNINEFIDFHSFEEMVEDTIVLNFNTLKEIEEFLIIHDDIEILASNGKSLIISSSFLNLYFSNDLLHNILDTGADLSISTRDVLKDISKEEHKQFMKGYIGEEGLDNLNLVTNCQVEVHCGDTDLMMGDYHPLLNFKISSDALSGIDIRKMGVYVDNPDTKELDYLGGTFNHTSQIMTLELMKPSPSYYFMIYEKDLTFHDINNSWAKDYIEVMSSRNIINGNGNDLFNPKGTLTRAEFVKLLVCAIDEELTNYKGDFTDCLETDWYTKYIEAGNRAGIIEEQIAFRPNDYITREEMTVMAVKAYKAYTGKFPVITSLTGFIDEAYMNQESLKFIQMACELNIISGMPDGSFNPTGILTREQSAKVIYKLLEAINI